jgi:hypothetical protein
MPEVDDITGNYAEGSMPILTRVRKVNSQDGDVHKDGTQGTVLGSVRDAEYDHQGNPSKNKYIYSVRFDNTLEAEAPPLFIIDTKVEPLPEAEQSTSAPAANDDDDPFGVEKARREERALILAKAEKALSAMEAVGVYPVAVREGWSLWCTTPHGWPACAFGVIKSSKQTTPHLWPGPWADPFTAVVEGVAWLKAEGVIDF